MPFRFRKIFSLGKGMRLNISKRGVSTSLGGHGASLNIGKRGLRPTVGLPGTGLSFTPTQAGSTQSTNGGAAINTIVFSIIGIIICILLVCVGSFVFIGGDTSATATPTIQRSESSISTIIFQTSSAAQTQTMIVAPPLATMPTFTVPTGAPPLMTSTIAPSFTPIPTDTPFIISTLQGQQPSNGEVCACTGVDYDCKVEDFSTHNQAQACFEYCKSLGYGDVHKLDNENDGLACENLP